MNVGFTGTRKGMSEAQRRQLAAILHWLNESGDDVFHHGDAIGADRQAAVIASDCDWIVQHHPAEGDPLRRNRALVALVDLLISAPLTDTEELRSGTWATIRYARKAGKPVIMLSRGE